MIEQRRREIRAPAKEDLAVQAVVLQQLLDLHPAQLSFDELLRALGEEEDFGRRDAVERAVQELAAAGLLNHNGALLAPSRAALLCDRLLCD